MTKVETDKYKQILSDVKDEKIATTLWLKWKCLTDLFFLGYEILGFKNVKDKKTGKPLVDPPFHSWLAECLNTNEDVMVIVARRHLKSTFVKLRILQNILIDPFVRQAMYSSTSDLVEQQLLDIKRLAAHPKLMALFPEVLVDPGPKGNGYQINRANQLTIFRDPKQGDSPQEAQIEVFGYGGNPVGKHFDKHFYDDLVTDKNSQTMEMIRKIREWYGYIQGVLEPWGQETYTGTPYHYEDLTNFIRTEQLYERIYIRGWKEHGKYVYHAFNEKVEKRLRSRSTPYQMSCQYDCNPQPKEDQIFPPPQPQFDTLPAGKYNYYIAVDPAATTKTYSDETAIIVAAVNEVSHVFVVEAWHYKKGGDETAKILLQLNEKYSPRKIGVEFGLQEHLRHVIDLTRSNWESAQGKSISLPIEAIQITKRDKYDRINLTVGSFVRSKRIFIKSTLIDLMTQMGLYNKNYSGKDDLVDALSMLFSIVEQFSFRYWKEPLGIIRQGVQMFEDFFKPKKKAVGYNERFSQ